jgi:phosphoribosylformylglycinamidine synthase
VGAMKANVSVDVMFKEGILDPQGKTVEESLPALGYEGVRGVRIGKHIEMVVEGGSEKEIMERVREMTQRFLSNPVIEDAEIRIDEMSSPA